jgi:serine protease Do
MPWQKTIAVFVLIAGFRSEARAEAGTMTPREIYKARGPSVVLVFSTDGSEAGNAGTGSIIEQDGQVITNAHVVTKAGKPYKRVFVYLKPEKLQGSMKEDLTHRYRATVVDFDEGLDLALLRMIDPPKGLPALRFADPRRVEVGEPVVAIGHPETGGLWTLTTGSISSVISDFQGVPGKDVFQTEASVNRGNSGGPLLNAEGDIVGINTSISRRAADGLAITDINFSLKSSVAVDWLKRRNLLALAYAKPPIDTEPAPSAPTPPQTEPNGPAISPPVTVQVVKPEAGQDVAEDREFSKAIQEFSTVSEPPGGMQRKEKAPNEPPAERVKPKHLTRVRPYNVDQFVEARTREIRALESMMQEMRGGIQDRKKSPTRHEGKGMGLW